MMFSSSNSIEDNGHFEAYNGFQLGSSSSPALWEDYNQFFVDHFLGMSQEQHHQFSLGHENDPNQLTLVENHELVDEMIVGHNFDGENQISCDMEKERVSCQTNHMMAIGSLSNGDIKRPAKRIRCGKKDRHSKICTAKGPRDRRMRLSLQIARKFFDLQDKLGFDKASKTIEWLFNMSKNAIKEVMENACSEINNVSKIPYGNQVGSADNISCENGRKDNTLASSLRDNEDAFSSRFKKITTNQKTYDYKDHCKDKLEGINKTKCRSMSMSKRLKNNSVPPHWSHLKKDVRDKARARARERTVEKMRLRAPKDPAQGLITTLETAASANNPSYHNSSEQIGCCSPLFEQVNSGAISLPVEELVHEDWETDNARIYSSFFCDEQSPNTISLVSFASQVLTNQLCLSTTTTWSNE